MAELVDASDSKSGIRKDVQVRFLFRAQDHLHSLKPALAAGFLARDSRQSTLDEVCKIFIYFFIADAVNNIPGYPKKSW